MLARNTIQKLDDSQLIRIFLDFVQTYHLQYEKINKEISYKCHEATWVLATTKATGYGRTQSQAYKHALRNLLEILVEDQNYSDFFESVFTNSNQNQGRKSYSGQNDEGASKKNHFKTQCYVQETKYSNMGHQSSTKNKRVRENKTEAYEEDYHKDYNEVSQATGNHCIPPSYPKNLISKQPKSNYQTSTLYKNQHNTSSASKLNTLYSHSKKNYTQESQYNTANKQREVHHSKINLNVLASSSASNTQPNNSNNKPTNPTLEVQLSLARQKMIQLEEQLAALTSANNDLRQRIQKDNRPKGGEQKSKVNLAGYAQNSDTISVTNQKSKKVEKESLLNDENRYRDEGGLQQQSKVFIPKLKLDILPNYHKKSQKSLNESLLAAYNEKHGGSKKMI